MSKPVIRSIITVGFYTAIDCAVFWVLRAIGFSELFAAFLILAQSANALRVLLEEHRGGR